MVSYDFNFIMDNHPDIFDIWARSINLLFDASIYDEFELYEEADRALKESDKLKEEFTAAAILISN